jgi:hypothetical protein
MFVYNNSFQVDLFKGPINVLVSLSSSIGSIDLTVNINSAVFTYERLNHRLGLYFNGFFISSIIANKAFVDDVIDWGAQQIIYMSISPRIKTAIIIKYPLTTKY